MQELLLQTNNQKISRLNISPWQTEIIVKPHSFIIPRPAYKTNVATRFLRSLGLQTIIKFLVVWKRLDTNI